MMKKLFAATLLTALSIVSFAQEDVNTLRQNARKSMLAGDHTTAIGTLNKASEMDRTNPEIKKDLALAYYYNKDYKKAIDIAEPLSKSDDADVASYQLAGMIYKAMDDAKGAEKLYQQALKDFPRSGPLYSEYGELLDISKRPQEAIDMWEKGMQVAPSYSGNYYNAAIYYYKQPVDKIFGILYGEIYSNMESLNPKTLAIKKMILSTYKDLFAGTNLQTAINDTKNAFAKAVLETYAKQSSVASQTITPETLGMVRTRFALDWNNANNKKFPFKLFEYHTQLMKDGLYDSYNQWMFGPADNEDAFKSWAELNKAGYEKFTEYHTSRIFKMPPGQVYSVK